MKAMRLARTAPVEERPLAAEEVPAPRPGEGEVLLRVEACGVCRTDLHIVEAEVSARLPVVPGHQAAGRVLEVGAGVDRLAPGDRVGVGWLSTTDGRCRFCTSGRVPVRAEIEVFSLEEANETLLRVKRGKVRGAAVLRT